MWDEGLVWKEAWVERRFGWKDWAKTCRIIMMMIAVMLILYGTDRPGLMEKTETSRHFCEFFLAPAELGGTGSDSPAARQVDCPHACEARVKGTALSAAAALLEKGRTPCGVLVKRWSNHNLFSLGPNWSPDGLISRVRHYTLSSLTPSRRFFFPYSFQVV